MNDSRVKGSITRRDVVAGSLGIGALTMGATHAGARSASGQSPGAWDLEADVVVIGTGALGLPAAIIAKKKYGIVDSPDLLFRDLTDWSVVEPNGFPDFRYNDREIVRAFADNAAKTYEWLAAHGVVFMDIAPGSFDGVTCGNSAPRSNYAAGLDWPVAYRYSTRHARRDCGSRTGKISSW